jgi:hypothetical protein
MVKLGGREAGSSGKRAGVPLASLYGPHERPGWLVRTGDKPRSRIRAQSSGFRAPALSVSVAPRPPEESQSHREVP